MKILEIHITDLIVARSPTIIITRSLGSCVAIILYDPATKIGAISHVMLPNSIQFKKNHVSGKFVDTAIPVMIDKMSKMNVKRDQIVAKLVGGAKIFKSVEKESPLNIGDRIVNAAINELRKNNIPIISQDIGKDHGRSVKFDISDGSVIVNWFGNREMVI